MKHQEKVEALMRQADFWYKLFDGRRNFEWKVTLGFWAALVGAANLFLIQESPKLEQVIIGGLFACILHWMWLDGIHLSHENDKNRMRFFLQQAELQLNNKSHSSGASPARITDPEKHFLEDWSLRFQFLTTLFLVLISIGIVGLG